MRLFLDTNVLIDYLAKRRPFDANAQKLILAHAYGDVDLWSSAKSTTDVFYFAQRVIPVSHLKEGMKRLFTKIHLCSITAQDVQTALSSPISDFEDALISHAAEKTQADFIVTRDESGFEEGNIPAVSPEYVLNLLESEYGVSYSLFSYDEDGNATFT